MERRAMVTDARTIGAERGMKPMDALKLLSGTVAGLVGAVPAGVQTSVMVAFLLTLMDTITGVWLAARRAEVRSHTMREQLAAKALQFLIIGALGACAAMLTRNWTPVGASTGIIIGIEAASNLENLTRLEMNGGAPLGPFRPLIWKLGKYFAVEEPPQRGQGQ